MLDEYADLDNGLKICSSTYLTGKKRPGVVVKNLKDYPLNDEDLMRLGAARVTEPHVKGYRTTGKAVLVGDVYHREYVDQTPEEAAEQDKAERYAAIEDITVTHPVSLRVYDGDKAARDALTTAVAAGEAGESTPWKLADNTVSVVAWEELRDVLRLVGVEHTALIAV